MSQGQAGDSKSRVLFPKVRVGHKSGLFLASLVGYYLLLPYIGWFGDILPLFDSDSFRVLLLMGVLLAGIRTVSESRRHFRIGLALGVPTLILDWVAYFIPSPALDVITLIGYLVFVSYVGIRILGYVLAPGEVHPDRLFAAVSFYFLIGIGFSIVYGMIEFSNPGSFSGLAMSGSESRPTAELLYYSFVTLTTLGYGEITPVTPQVRSLAAIEAMMGVFYVAIMVARLVTLYSQSGKR